MSVNGIFPTSSTQVHAYTTTTGQFKKYVPATASGIAMPYIVTAREYISNIVSPPEPKTPFMMISFTDRPIM